MLAGATGVVRDETFVSAMAALDVDETWEEGSGPLVRVDMAEAIFFSFSSENCERMFWMLLVTAKLGMVAVELGAVDVGTLEASGCDRGWCSP